MEKNKVSDKDLIKYLEGIRSKEKPPVAEMKKYLQYYNGSQHDTQQDDKLKNAYNVIKPVIETKVSMVCKAQITDAVVAKSHSLGTLNEISIADKLAAAMDDIRKSIWKDNKERTFDERANRTAAIKGAVIGRVSWNAEACDGLGQVVIETLDPEACSWDYSVDCISKSNYFFYSPKKSLMDIKKQFAVDKDGKINEELMKKLDTISGDSSSDGNSDVSGSENAPVTNYEINDVGGQLFAYDNPISSTTTKKVTVIECYFKDDTIFFEEVNDDNIKEKQKRWRMKYPIGRKIVYISQGNNKIKLSDEALDEKIGYPLEVFEWVPNEEDCHRLQGVSEAKDLMYIQDRINRLAARRTFLIQQAQRYLAFDPKYVKLTLNDFGTNPILEAQGLGENPNAVGVFAIETIKDAADLKVIMEEYRNEALSIARLSDTIISGSHEPGVRSAKQVEELKESPLNTIESIQQRYYEFKTSLTLKALKMAQHYYDVTRTIRITGGDVSIKLPTQQDLIDTETGQQVNPEQSPIVLARPMKGNQEDATLQPGEELDPITNQIIQNINSDLRLFDFDIELISGSAQARSPQENAALTLKLLEMGVFEGRYGIETTKMVLRNTDFPNRAAIIADLERKDVERQEYTKSTPYYIQMIKDGDPAKIKGVGELIHSLKLNSSAKEEILGNCLGINAENAPVDKLDEAPAQEVMSKGEPDKVAAISPSTVSRDDTVAEEGQQKAEEILVLKESAKISKQQNIGIK